MPSPLSRNPLAWAAGVAAAAGLILALQAGFAVRDSSRKVRAYAAQHSQVNDLSRSVGRGEAAVRLFAGLPQAQPQPLAPLLKEAFPGQKYDSVEQSAPPPLPGWVLRRMDVTLANVPLDQLGQFLSKAEAQRPPWRLVSCRIRATGSAAGAAQVNLVMEALEKVSASPPAR